MLLDLTTQERVQLAIFDSRHRGAAARRDGARRAALVGECVWPGGRTQTRGRLMCALAGARGWTQSHKCEPEDA